MISLRFLEACGEIRIRIFFGFLLISVLAVSLVRAEDERYSDWIDSERWRNETILSINSLNALSGCSQYETKNQDTRNIFENCCVCFWGEDPEEHVSYFQEYCRSWLKSQKSFCSGKAAISLPHSQALTLAGQVTPLPLSCSKVRVFGAFHGDVCDYRKPFKIAATLSKRLLAKEVCYDGVSCLLFNNTEKLAACAADIQSRDCEFSLAGNQNIFLCRAEKSFWTQKRQMVPIEESSSKTRVTVPRSGKIVIQHDDCSLAESPCGFDFQFFLIGRKGASNSPQKKSCFYRGKLTHQTCCQLQSGESPSVHYGVWSKPGEACPKL